MSKNFPQSDLQQVLYCSTDLPFVSTHAVGPHVESVHERFHYLRPTWGCQEVGSPSMESVLLWWILIPVTSRASGLQQDDKLTRAPSYLRRGGGGGEERSWNKGGSRDGRKKMSTCCSINSLVFFKPCVVCPSCHFLPSLFFLRPTFCSSIPFVPFVQSSTTGASFADFTDKYNVFDLLQTNNYILHYSNLYPFAHQTLPRSDFY